MYDMFDEEVDRWVPTKQIDVGTTFARQNVSIEPNKIISIPIIDRKIPSITPDKVIISPEIVIPNVRTAIPNVRRIQITNPPDYTPYATGAAKPGLISQDGLAKRTADLAALKAALSPKMQASINAATAKLVKTAPLVKAVELVKKVVGVSSVEAAHIVKTHDYTDYPSGAEKTGLISQEGLAKRVIDTYSQKKTIALIETKSNPVTTAKASSEGGFLYWVDKFFIWVNRIMGE